MALPNPMPLRLILPVPFLKDCAVLLEDQHFQSRASFSFSDEEKKVVDVDITRNEESVTLFLKEIVNRRFRKWDPEWNYSISFENAHLTQSKRSARIRSPMSRKIVRKTNPGLNNGNTQQSRHYSNDNTNEMVQNLNMKQGSDVKIQISSLEDTGNEDLQVVKNREMQEYSNAIYKTKLEGKVSNEFPPNTISHKQNFQIEFAKQIDNSIQRSSKRKTNDSCKILKGEISKKCKMKPVISEGKLKKSLINQAASAMFDPSGIGSQENVTITSCVLDEGSESDDFCHNKKDMPCPDCKISFINSASLCKHIRRVHKDHPNIQEISAIVENMCFPPKHKGNGVPVVTNCPYCGVPRYGYSVIHHIKCCHFNEPDITRIIRNFKMQNKEISKKNIHERARLKRKEDVAQGMMHPCSHCGKSYPYAASRWHHEKYTCSKNPNIKEYKRCSICPFTTNKMDKFEEHKLIHANQAPQFICDVCGKQYRARAGLTAHERKQHGIARKKKLDLYQCPNCDMKFYQNSKLARHVLKHTEERKCQCDVCGKQFKSIIDMRRHARTTHEKQSTYICKKCGHGVRTQRALKKHTCDQVKKPRLNPIQNGNTVTDCIGTSHHQVSNHKQQHHTIQVDENQLQNSKADEHIPDMLQEVDFQSSATSTVINEQPYHASHPPPLEPLPKVIRITPGLKKSGVCLQKFILTEPIASNFSNAYSMESAVMQTPVVQQNQFVDLEMPPSCVFIQNPSVSSADDHSHAVSETGSFMSLQYLQHNPNARQVEYPSMSTLPATQSGLQQNFHPLEPPAIQTLSYEKKETPVKQQTLHYIASLVEMPLHK